MSEIEIVYKVIEDLNPYENNPRYNDGAVDAVANSIREFGFKNPILIDKNNGIVAGHTRYKAAIKNGMEKIPCIMVDDLTDEQIKAYRLVDNKTAELSDWDIEKLEQELTEILFIDMSLFGFGEDDNLADDLIDYKYTLAVNIPQYKITGDCPELSDLLDTDKSDELIAEIEVAEGVTDEEKEFLKYAAHRHNVFNYRNVAEYYAHATPQMQRLMEKSALVIIDVDDAIANGYASLMADVLDMMVDE